MSAFSGATRSILFVVTEDWYFISHRLWMAKRLVESGWNVSVATRVTSNERRCLIEAAGVGIVDVSVTRGKLFGWGDLQYGYALYKRYKEYRPSVVHHVAMKPILYGSLAALVCSRPYIVNAFAGLGYLFTGNRQVLRVCVSWMLAAVCRHPRCWVVVQNADDRNVVYSKWRVPSNKIVWIKGSGVKVKDRGVVRHAARERPVAMLACRMLKDKGVIEFVEAARILVQRGVRATFLLVGGIDSENPSALDEVSLRKLTADGVVQWLGHCSDMERLYLSSDIAVLPSYREGLPRSLIEACAAGLPLVATDVPGCRDIVRDGVNGFLVPVKDVHRLADVMGRLLCDHELRARFGRFSRSRAEDEYDEARIADQFITLYNKLVERCR